MKQKYYVCAGILNRDKVWLYTTSKFNKRKLKRKEIENFVKYEIYESFILLKKNKVFYIDILIQGPGIKKNIKRKKIVVNRLSRFYENLLRKKSRDI